MPGSLVSSEGVRKHCPGEEGKGRPLYSADSWQLNSLLKFFFFKSLLVSSRDGVLTPPLHDCGLLGKSLELPEFEFLNHRMKWQ